jgi:preprotein translocase subunit SecB
MQPSPEIKEAKFFFRNFIVKESHIVLNEAGENTITVNINPKGFVFKELNQFQLEMIVEIIEQTNRFNIKMTTVSMFEFEPSEDFEKYRNDFFTKNAPAIVFPYIRAYIANLTSQSGLFTILLPTYNLTPLSETLKNNIQEMA